MKRLLLILVLVLVITLSTAQPPLTTVLVFPEGYNFAEINYQEIKVGENFTYFFYLFNSSTGLKIDNETVNCTFYMTDSKGNILINAAEVYQPNGYWYTNISGDLIDEIGYYYYGVDCSNGYGGALSGVFEVTYTGRGITEAQSILYSVLLAIMVLSFFLIFIGMSYLPQSNHTDEQGRLLQISYLKYFRVPLWIFAYFLFAGILFISSNIAFAYLNEVMFGKTLFMLFTLLMVVSPIVIILLVISFFIQFFHDKEFQRLLNRGIMPGGEL